MTVPTHPAVHARRVRRPVRAHPDVLALSGAATLGLLVAIVAAASAPTHIDRLEINTETELRLTVSVRGEDDVSRTPIAYVWPGSTDVAAEFPDAGSTWIIHLGSEIGTSAEVTVPRADLEGAGWTYRIDSDVGLLLRR